MRFAYEQHIKLIAWSSLEDKDRWKMLALQQWLTGAGCAVGEMPRSVIQSVANQPMDVQVELISGRSGDVFLKQADLADTLKLRRDARHLSQDVAYWQSSL